MFDSGARAFFDRVLIARLSTFGTDGYPHLVPIWYLLSGDEVLLISDRATQKIRNLRENPRAAVVVGGDVPDGAGYLVRGDISIEEDEQKAITHRMIDRYENAERAAILKEEWRNDDIVVLRLKPISVKKVF